MSATLVAMVFAMAAAAAGLVRSWKLRQAVSFDLDALRAALGRGAGHERLRELRAALEAEDPSWEAELVAGLVDATTPEERTALVNEALHDAARLLTWGGQIPKAATRCAVVGPLCVLFWSLAGQTLAVAQVLPVLGWSASGVIASIALGHDTSVLVAHRRSSIDRWVDQLLIAAGLR